MAVAASPSRTHAASGSGSLARSLDTGGVVAATKVVVAVLATVVASTVTGAVELGSDVADGCLMVTPVGSVFCGDDEPQPATSPRVTRQMASRTRTMVIGRYLARPSLADIVSISDRGDAICDQLDLFESVGHEDHGRPTVSKVSDRAQERLSACRHAGRSRTHPELFEQPLHEPLGLPLHETFAFLRLRLAHLLVLVGDVFQVVHIV